MNPISPVSAQTIDGQEVWSEGDSIVYEADLVINYNRQLTIGDQQVFPETQYPNIDLSGGEYTLTFKEILAGEMVFVLSSKNSVLQAQLLGGASQASIKIDPNTGLSESGSQTTYFGNTTFWHDGYETVHTEEISYEDDSGVKSETKTYEVAGPKRNYTDARVDGLDEHIPVFDTKIEAFDLEYTASDTDFLESFEDLILIFSAKGGVFLGQELDYTLKLNNEGERPYITGYEFSISVRASKINGVNLVGEDLTTTSDKENDGEEDEGFVSTQSYILMTSLVILPILRRLQKHDSN